MTVYIYIKCLSHTFVRTHVFSRTAAGTTQNHVIKMGVGDPDWATPGATTGEATQNAATGGNITASANVGGSG